MTVFLNLLLFSLTLCYSNSQYSDKEKDFVNEWAVKLRGGVSDMKAITRKLGLTYVRKIDGLENLFVVKQKRLTRGFNQGTSKRLRRDSQVVWQEQQRRLIRHKRVTLYFNDRHYSKQWYLLGGGVGGYDMNVQKAWEMGYSGSGVTVSILDDGIARTHPELKSNYDPQASFDFNDNDSDPSPRIDYTDTNRHGTRCASGVAGAANNSFCGVGIAYRANIGGVRMLDGEVTDSIEASALSFNRDHIDIYSSAWGPDDNGKEVEGPGYLASKALELGVEKGRGGLGSIFMWASGNGGRYNDTCACDGYAGSIYTLSISSVSENNRRPWYLEPCASTIASTYSSGDSMERKVVTATLRDKCSFSHSGTSASVSLAAGIMALALEANRNLTWRDVQYLTIVTSNPSPFVDADWVTNGVGRKVSLLYGYGLMDAAKMVYLAPLWRRTPEQRQCRVAINFNETLRNTTRITKHSVTIRVDGCANTSAGGIRSLEHVQLNLEVFSSRRGSLKIALRSPSGTLSIMLLPRIYDHSRITAPFNTWPLTSVHFWGESAAGEWTLYIENVDYTIRTGKFESGFLVLYGVTEEQPIRLKPPSDYPASPPWFEQQFRSLVVEDPVEVEVNETTVASECHEECANSTACSGERANQCESCRHFKVSSDGSCVAKCPPETFPAQHLCQSCHLQCAKCIGPSDQNCTECHSGSALIPSQHRCLSRGEPCPHGTYLSNDKRKCLPCAIPCESCASLKRCYQCRIDNGTWVLSPTGQCVRACPARYYVSSDRKCKPCHQLCYACIGGRSDACLACPNGHIFLKANRSDSAGSCVRRCPVSSMREKGACLKCHQTCERCSGRQDRCMTCREPLIMNKGGCVDPMVVLCKKGTLMIQCLTRMVKSSLWMLHRLMRVLTPTT